MDNKELNKEELEQVNGGYSLCERDGKYYEYIGDENSNKNLIYLCPICKRPVHYGSWWSYYCDPCNKSWFIEDDLDPNVNGGLWKEISESQFRTYERDTRSKYNHRTI